MFQSDSYKYSCYQLLILSVTLADHLEAPMDAQSVHQTVWTWTRLTDLVALHKVIPKIKLILGCRLTRDSSQVDIPRWSCRVMSCIQSCKTSFQKRLASTIVGTVRLWVCLSGNSASQVCSPIYPWAMGQWTQDSGPTTFIKLLCTFSQIKQEVCRCSARSVKSTCSNRGDAERSIQIRIVLSFILFQVCVALQKS